VTTLNEDVERETRLPASQLVAMAASAGGLNALTRVLRSLPAGFPAAVAVVQHLDPRHRSLMAQILGRSSALPVHEAEHGDFLSAGEVCIAPPDHHLLINSDGSVSLTRSEMVHFVRPSADLLFESAAASYRERLIAVVLSGMGTDGALGLRAVKETGGRVIVQTGAEFVGMPTAAIETGNVDLVLALDEIAPMLLELVRNGIEG
jgi:two-component system chemotaxis response regulator CheB